MKNYFKRRTRREYKYDD